MKKLLVLSSVLLSSASAFAFTAGKYECKAADKTVPSSRITISDVAMPGGLSAPFVEVVRYYREVANDPNSEVIVSTVKGLASVHTYGRTETLALAALRLQFVDGKLDNCKE